MNQCDTISHSLKLGLEKFVPRGRAGGLNSVRDFLLYVAKRHLRLPRGEFGREERSNVVKVGVAAVGELLRCVTYIRKEIVANVGAAGPWFDSSASQLNVPHQLVEIAAAIAERPHAAPSNDVVALAVSGDIHLVCVPDQHILYEVR